MSEQALCELCGEPMPKGEEMFKFHGYSGPCPKPPLPKSGSLSDLKYNFGGHEGNQLEPLVAAVAGEAIKSNKKEELKEYCYALLKRIGEDPLGEIHSAHHALDLLNVRRTMPDSDGHGESKLTLMGRIKELKVS